MADFDIPPIPGSYRTSFCYTTVAISAALISRFLRLVNFKSRGAPHPLFSSLTLSLNDEERRFVERVAHRLSAPKTGVVIKTKLGDVVVSSSEQARLELLARREGMPTSELIEYHVNPAWAAEELAVCESA